MVIFSGKKPVSHLFSDSEGGGGYSELKLLASKGVPPPPYLGLLESATYDGRSRGS